MAASSGESQLQRIIRDLQDAVTELSKEFSEAGEPITDDCINLHKFSYKLEYLLQFDQKEKSTLLGNRKDYWDYFCDCLAKVKGANDGIRFVKSISELRTSLGKGRAFIRYSLMHQRLADTLQQCFMNTKVTSDWYYARSPFLNAKLSSDIVGQLYELTEVQFDLASRGYDLDTAWPTFARRTLSSYGSSAYLWKPPSRSSSMSSLVSSYLQTQEMPSSPNGNNCLNTEPLEGLDEMRAELDQAEMQQKELRDRIQHLEKENWGLQAAISLEKGQAQAEREKSSNLSEENFRLTKMLGELEKQHEISHCTQDTVQDLQKCLQALELNSQEKQKEYSTRLEDLLSSKKDSDSKLLLLNEELESVRTLVGTKVTCIEELTAKLKIAEQKNEELVSQTRAFLDERGHQAACQDESALMIEELLGKLHKAEKDKADVQKLHDEHLAQLKIMEEQLNLKEQAQKELESKLKSLPASSEEGSGKLQSTLGTMARNTADLEKELAAKGTEVANLQIKLEDSLAHVRSLEKHLEEERKERERLEEEFSYRRTTMEQEAKNLTEQLALLGNRLSKLTEQVASLEEEKRELVSDRDYLIKSVESLEQKERQQNSSWTDVCEENKKLKLTNQNLEDRQREMDTSKSSLEAEFAKLTAFEKELRGEMFDAVLEVDEREKKVRERNQQLAENLQNAIKQNQTLQDKLHNMESDYQDLIRREKTIKKTLAVLQAEQENTKEQGLKMEKGLASLKQYKESLRLQLKEKDNALQALESQLKQLQEEVESYRKKAEGLEAEKADVEKTVPQTQATDSAISLKAAVEKAQLEGVACEEKESKELALRLALSEEQLCINQEEVLRLHAERADLHAKLQQVTAEKQTLQGRLDVGETLLNEQKALVQQLKEQNELLNRTQVQELLDCRNQEETLKDKRDKEVHHKAELERNLLGLTEELSKAKQCLEAVSAENMEIKEVLYRTNTEMAELGIQICTLTSEKSEAEEKLSQVTGKLQAAEATAAREQEALQLDLSRLSQENRELQEKLKELKSCVAAVPGLQTQLEMAERQAQSLQETRKEELSAVKFQLSTEIINYQIKFKAITEECEKLKQQVEEPSRRADAAEEALRELQAVKRELSHELDLAMDQVTEYKTAKQKKEEEVEQLKADLERTQKEVNKANEQIQDYYEKLDKMRSERDSNDQKLMAELDDLTRTKQFLEERLIELLRDKDALWQKSDALEFQQKLTAEQRWLGDAEVSCCQDCQKDFGWMNRRHHCRLCGRIFCYYCCNHYALSKHTGKKERCCRACFKKSNAASSDSGSNTSQEEPLSLFASPLSLVRKVMVTTETSKPTDEAPFDIITDEEVGQLQDEDSVHNESQTEEESLDRSMTDLNSTYNSSTFDESEEPQMAQDAEICLLKSGELMIKLPLTVEEILNFGEANRELFIKSNTYSIIPITVEEPGLTISWVFSSEPKSISFSVVYQESEEAPLDQCKVLIPMTRCNSHKETIRGKVKVRNSGIYMLIFDNTFSRFISKKVFYHLTLQRPVIYDGSDFP
ncbi:FYVE and coiled-coil domain-containing protein 1 [Heteronotia binoei]|uniref:FYVE and coiled-coil domain-containing protein 1 n=1 Tax=Heteronotia binoei TaxID=13085 RepID=UPI00292D05E4|nr:FYVE and coiled-coil domain-containing protein 1 [Heteronotia binoei]XP_060104886.1 FYVE and coiled-coil domain-containing protein 1 [Heteronotia binoei]